MSSIWKLSPNCPNNRVEFRWTLTQKKRTRPQILLSAHILANRPVTKSPRNHDGCLDFDGIFDCELLQPRPPPLQRGRGGPHLWSLSPLCTPFAWNRYHSRPLDDWKSHPVVCLHSGVCTRGQHRDSEKKLGLFRQIGRRFANILDKLTGCGTRVDRQPFA